MPKRELATGKIFSCYPSEHDEILRLQKKLTLRSPFDVIRKALIVSGLGKRNAIREPKKPAA